MRFLSRRACIIVWFAIIWLAACAPADPESPIELTSSSLKTQIAAIRRSATVAVERLQITVIGARSQLEQIRGNYESLSGTLAARGYDPASVALPTAAAGSAARAAARSTATALIITPPATVGTSESDETRSVPRLSDFRIGLEVGGDDCIAAPLLTLAANVPAIYTSARAENLPAGARLRTIWYAAGEERASLTYAPDFAIEDSCVWFFIDPSDTPFVPGAWEVRWELADLPYPSQSFTITTN